MTKPITTYNQLVYALSKRARYLAGESMDALRLHAGFNCSSPGEARSMNKGKSRGELLEDILTEEFCLELDRNIE